MAVDQLQEWLADPTGRHRYRLHADGRPTEWVSDGNAISEDPLPPAAVSGPGSSPAERWPTATSGSPDAATAPARPAGWYRNAADPDEVRYWDGAGWAAPPEAEGRVSGSGSPTGVEPPEGVVGQVVPGATPVDPPSVRAAEGPMPADWYPDPADRTRLRYWDGLGWTEQVLGERPTRP